MSPSHTRRAVLVALLYAAACAPVPAPPTAMPPAATHSPTTPAATATAVPPIATAAPSTAAPAPSYFTQSFDARPPYWSFVQVDNGSAAGAPSVQDGALVFDLPAPNQWAYALYGGQRYADVLVEAQVQTPITGDAAAGLVCRYDAQQGWYELDVFGDGTYQLLFGQWLSSGLARYTPLYRGEGAAVMQAGNTVGLLCQGTLLQPSINGTALHRWQETRYVVKQGQIGLSASSFADAPYSAAFEWVRVSRP